MSLSVIVFSMFLSVIVYLSGCLCVSQCLSVSRFALCVVLDVSPNVAPDVACVSMSLSVSVFSMFFSVVVYLSGCLCVSQCFSVSRFCFSMLSLPVFL